MRESCNSRSLSWLTKSCIPDDPRRDIAPHRPAAAAAAAPSPISCLPDDLLLECLSRAPSSSLPSLPLVSRRFSLLLSSPAFLHLRRLRAPLRPTLLALSLSHPTLLSFSSLPLASPTWSPLSSPFPGGAAFSHARIAAIGRAIYIIGRGATLRYDAWTGAAAARSPTLHSRRKFAAAALGGKIYVAGGGGGGAAARAVEEYDPDTDTWREVAEVPRQRYRCVGAAAGGVFYVIGGMPVGEAEAAAAAQPRACAGSMDAYHVGAGAWLRGAAAVPAGGCAVGACGVGPYVYVVASHAVELSFWRWDGRRRRGGGGGDGWTRLETPPVTGQLRAARFSCTAVGESKVVVLVQSSGGRARDPAVEGAVLVYDIAGGEWSRGPDLPPGLRRAALSFVEC